MEDVAFLINLLNTGEPSRTYNPSDYDQRVIALSQRLYIEGDLKEMNKIYEDYESDYGDVLCYKDRIYFVADEYDANEVFEEKIKDDLEYLLYDNIDPKYHYYIDEESFVLDKMREYNRGDFLARYDGLEHRAEVNGEDYYIYRIK